LILRGSTTKEAGGAATLIAIAGPSHQTKRASHIVLDNQGSYRVGEDGADLKTEFGRLGGSKCGHGAAYALKARGKATLPSVTPGKSSVMKIHENAECV